MRFSELSQDEQDALTSLYKYGGAEDCRAGLREVAAFELLALKGLVVRRQDETWINEYGKEIMRLWRAVDHDEISDAHIAAVDFMYDEEDATRR